MDNLQQAIAAIKAGDKVTGKRLLAEVLQTDPRNEAAWLWLSYAVDNVAQKRQCLERVLKLNPANQTARRQLGAIDRLEAATVQPVQAAPRRRGTESKSIGKPKKRTGLTIGLVIAGVVTVVCVSLVGIWWVISNGLLQVAPPTPIPTEAPTLTATLIPTWTPTPTPSARAEVEGYLSEFCPLMGEGLAVWGEEQRFWADFDADRFVSSADYRDQLAVQYTSLAQRIRTVEDKFRRLTPPQALREHHRLLVLAFDHHENAIALSLQVLETLDLAAAEQTAGEIEMFTSYFEQSLDELVRVATDLGVGHTCDLTFPTTEPTATPTPFQTWTPAPTLTPLPALDMTEAEFRVYLKGKFSSIAGNQLQIESIFIFVEEDPSFPVRAVTIELTRDSALYVFSEQTEADALEYGTNLLHDTIAYFGGQDCAAYVSDSYYTHELEDYHFDEEWYYIGDYDLDDGWYVSKDYVKAHYIGGIESVEVWNWR